MKLNTKNFSGIKGFPYWINWNKEDAKAKEVMVFLSIQRPDGSYTYLDCVSSSLHKTYAENVKTALLRAEEKWDLDLLKLDIDLKTA